MKPTTSMIIIVLLALIIGAGWYVFSRQGAKVLPIPSPSPIPSPTPQVTPSPSLSPQAGVTIVMNASGFSPSTVTITRGTTVTFVNQDSGNHWPASGVHPTHQLCPGFDALRGVAPGERYSYTFNFTPPKVCPFHDHLTPSLTGKITIQ